MRKILLLILIFTCYNAFPQVGLVDYVDPFIGVRDEASNCVIGPQLPFGSINPSPHTKNGSQDCYSIDEPIRGFAQLHVSGTGWGKYGQILFSPQVGLAIDENAHDSEKSKECAKPYEYSVFLNRYNINVDVTPSYHSAIYRFTFPESKEANIVLDLSHSVCDIVKNMNGGILDGELSISQDKNSIEGFGEYVGGFGEMKYRVYFVAELSKKALKVGTFRNGKIINDSFKCELKNEFDRLGCFMNFETHENEDIFLKVAVSLRSLEQARYWLNNEIVHFEYDDILLKAKKEWNKQLSKITIETNNKEDLIKFYTALYHSYLMPRNRTNDSSHFDDEVPVWDDHFAIWDTWRTLYPLHTLINSDMVSGTINSFIARFKKNGMVKDAYISCGEMIEEQGGNNIDNVISDAYLKGIDGVDWHEAYKVLKNNADNERLGSWRWNKDDETNTYKDLGWIVNGRMANSMTLEYAYNDYCVSQVAKGLGYEEDYRTYKERSNNWTNLWNPDASSDGFKGFVDSRRADGTFVGIDYKKYPGSWDMHFYEGSSWTYSWFAPHQFDKLVSLNGGNEKFVKKLQYGLDNNLIDYGNEPAFLSIYGFHYSDRSDLVYYYVDKLLKERFTNEGYSGNDDSGAMSSMYLFSQIGFFPNAGQDIYYINAPKFKKVIIKMSNGKEIIISAPNCSDQNIYVKSVKINGQQLNEPWFKHELIKNGALIEYEMVNKLK